jgi:hypothetical protein
MAFVPRLLPSLWRCPPRLFHVEQLLESLRVAYTGSVPVRFHGVNDPFR